jgi:hypothetical protein
VTYVTCMLKSRAWNFQIMHETTYVSAHRIVFQLQGPAKHAARLRCKLAGCGAEGDRERETNLCIQEGKIIRKKSN